MRNEPKNKGFYLLAAVIIIVMLATVSITITRSMFGSFFSQPLTKIFFNHLADAVLLLSPCWVLKRRRTYTFIIVWLVALWSFIQLLYYQVFYLIKYHISHSFFTYIMPLLFPCCNYKGNHKLYQYFK